MTPISYFLGGCTSVSVLLYGVEATKHDASLSSSYVLAIFSLFFTVLLLIFVILERKGWVIPSKEDILSMCICPSVTEYFDNNDRSIDKAKANLYENEETFSNYSKSTLELWLSSVSGADGISVSSYAESRQNTSEFSGSTEIINYLQEPLKSISLSSLESTV